MKLETEIKKYAGKAIAASANNLADNIESEVLELATDYVGKLPSLDADSKDFDARLDRAITVIEKELAKQLVAKLKKEYRLK